MLLFGIGFLDIHWLDILDILLVTGLLYHLYQLVKGSVALKIFLGFLSVYLAYLVVRATEMALLTEILGEFIGVGFIAVLILFQNEIRRFLMLLGQGPDFHDLIRWGSKEDDPLPIEDILGAMNRMSKTCTGALIVLSKDDPLKEYVASGDELDAKISQQLLSSVFFKNAPLHDGAVIIHDNRIVAARCILPVSPNPHIPASMGLRHRAAVGITEVTDTIALTVSEETGKMSFVREGQAAHGLSIHEIRAHVKSYWDRERSHSEEFPSS